MSGTQWVVCPVFRDVPSFLELRRELSAVLAGRGARSVRFVVVDDTGGTDPAVSELAGLDDVVVMTPPYNLGHQGAIVFGLRSLAPAIGAEDVVVTMDADGEDRPVDVPRLLDELEAAGPGAVAVARRTLRTEGIRFRFAYRLFKLLFRAATGRSIASGNFAALPGGFVRGAVFHPVFDFCYSASLLVLASRIVPVDAPRGTRYVGRSRMSSNRLVGHGLRMLVPFFDAIAVRALLMLAVLVTAGAICLAAVVIWSPGGALGTALTSLGVASVLGGVVGGTVVLAMFTLWISLISPAVQRALGYRVG